MVFALVETKGIYLGETRVGYHSDMVTFTPDGRNLLVANEGELEDLEDPTSYDPVGGSPQGEPIGVY